MTEPEIRPRTGTLHRAAAPVTEAPVPVRLVPTEDPLVFLAVTVDGERVIVHEGDEIHVDALGPGQKIRATGPTVTQTYGGSSDDDD